MASTQVAETSVTNNSPSRPPFFRSKQDKEVHTIVVAQVFRNYSQNFLNSKTPLVSEKDKELPENRKVRKNRCGCDFSLQLYFCHHTLTDVVLEAAKQVISPLGKNEKVCEMSKN